MLKRIDQMSVFIGEKMSILFLVAVGFTAFEVVMRYVFNAPTIWVHDSVTTLCAIGFLFGGVYAQQADKHMRISIVYDLSPVRVKRVLVLFQHLVSIGFLIFFIKGAWSQAYKSVSIMETSGRAWDAPMPAIIKTVILVASVLILFQALAQFARDLFGGKPGSERTI